MIVVKRSFVREIDVSASVIAWNYWDHEHLTVVHKGYVDAQVIDETPDTLVILESFRVPFFSFLVSKSLTTSLLSRENGDIVFRNFNLGLFGIGSRITITLHPLSEDRTRVSVAYVFFLEGWRRLLKPPLGRMMEAWFERTWREDLPLRLRRQRVLRLGFKDFAGLPERVADRRRDGSLDAVLPVPRLLGSPVDRLRRSQ